MSGGTEPGGICRSDGGHSGRTPPVANMLTRAKVHLAEAAPTAPYSDNGVDKFADQRCRPQNRQVCCGQSARRLTRRARKTMSLWPRMYWQRLWSGSRH